MTKNPSRKLPKVFILVFPQMPAIRILILAHFGEWKVVVVVCRPGLRRLGGVRNLIVLIIPQVIRILHFQVGEWGVVVVVVVCCPKRGTRSEVKKKILSYD